MSIVWHIGDTHFGHKNIGKYRAFLGLDTEDKNTEAICDEWTSLVKKRDKVFVHGDAAFTEESLTCFKKLAGTKILIAGNHDNLPARVYLTAFDDVVGTIGYKQAWLSHFPIHSGEFRKKIINIHAHCHMDGIGNSRFFNVSCCWLKHTYGCFLIRHTEIMEKYDV